MGNGTPMERSLKGKATVWNMHSYAEMHKYYPPKAGEIPEWEQGKSKRKSVWRKPVQIKKEGSQIYETEIRHSIRSLEKYRFRRRFPEELEEYFYEAYGNASGHGNSQGGISIAVSKRRGQLILPES